MEIFHSLHEIPRDFGPTVVSIGNFDGVHYGHQWLLAEIQRSARELGAKSVGVTFDPHPSRVLRPQGAPGLITPIPSGSTSSGLPGSTLCLCFPSPKSFAKCPARTSSQRSCATDFMPSRSTKA